MNAQEDIDAIKQWLANWVILINDKKDAAKVAASYTEDCMLLGPNMPNKFGREAVRKHMQTLIDSGLKYINGKHISIETNGNLGTDVTNYHVENADGEIIGTGRTHCVWKKIDGVWYCHRDAWGLCPIDTS
ncbi:unnamed protein product [Owenia fusiformis]|uniref:Uncharacterized protein n=1 Tax=Owenia fusiformis TaxID=6347 RepID=A0A8J1XTZ0_OWEFU|nr:unnamed protein product [Owenia fusiformis]